MGYDWELIEKLWLEGNAAGRGWDLSGDDPCSGALNWGAQVAEIRSELQASPVLAVDEVGVLAVFNAPRPRAVHIDIELGADWLSHTLRITGYQ
jgi:hypothetical protein